jgi:hypothetical protein
MRQGRRVRGKPGLLPPPPLPPPGMGAIRIFAPPVPRRNHTVLIVVSVLGAFLLVVCAGGALLSGVVYSAYRGMQHDAIDNVDGYLGDLRGGRFTAAYDRLCPEVANQRSVTEFARSQQAEGAVVRYTIDREIKVDDDGDWVVTASVTRAELPARIEYFRIEFDHANTPRVCPT